MYDPNTRCFIAEPPKCMSRTVEEIVRTAAGTLGKAVNMPGHLSETQVLSSIADMPGPLEGYVMVMREPVARMRSILSFTKTPRDSVTHALDSIDRMVSENAGYAQAYTPQVEYLSTTPIHVPKYFFTRLSDLAAFVGYTGPIPHNNPTPRSRRLDWDDHLARAIVAERYQADVALYNRVIHHGWGALTIPADPNSILPSHGNGAHRPAIHHLGAG